MNSVPTYKVEIHIAGDLKTIEHACREFCISGMCVTVTPTTFVFTGGAETGATIGLINYPRFQSEPGVIAAKAIELASCLLVACCQRSCSVVTPNETIYKENKSITAPR